MKTIEPHDGVSNFAWHSRTLAFRGHAAPNARLAAEMTTVQEGHRLSRAKKAAGGSRCAPSPRFSLSKPSRTSTRARSHNSVSCAAGIAKTRPVCTVASVLAILARAEGSTAGATTAKTATGPAGTRSAHPCRHDMRNLQAWRHAGNTIDLPHLKRNTDTSVQLRPTLRTWAAMLARANRHDYQPCQSGQAMLHPSGCCCCRVAGQRGPQGCDGRRGPALDMSARVEPHRCRHPG